MSVARAMQLMNTDNMPQFPNDENGQLLQQMYNAGDDITQPRIVDFCFVFTDRERALAFVTDVNDKNIESCLSWYGEKSMWQVIIKQDMAPEYERITVTESALAAKAQKVGGKADGWGCMQIPKK